MIILNSLTAINELFLKRSSIYSDRPHSVMAGEMYGIPLLMSLPLGSTTTRNN